MARGPGAVFTVPTPQAVQVDRSGSHWWMEVDGRRLRLSNLDKVFWADEGYTKGDLVAYYLNVASLMLPHLRDRPLTMKRMPDGAGGPYFYEKQAPSHAPDWMPRCRVEHDDSATGNVGYLMVRETAGLLFVANLGCIEFHPLHSRCGSIDEPDYLFFDLDPFEPATFDDVQAVALHVRAALAALGLPAIPKTSGATGMQIYVPVRPGYSYQEVRDFVAAVGRHIRSADPARVTMEWDISKRAGKVFIDHNMNRRGANIVAAYAVRPEPGATVSTPLTWEEVEQGVHPSQFTIATVHDRFARTGDLFSAVLSEQVDIDDALRAMGVGRRDGPPGRRAGDSRPDLAEYARKRDFTATPEPGAQVAGRTGNSFVIQKHRATRLHYDLRLERDGVLVSWAVPRGLPTTPGDRRLAVQTEDHPIDYGSFEGAIPQGNYGAGVVRIFDRGTYADREWQDGKITVRLEGTRYRGEYHLVRTRDRDWLVMVSGRAPAASFEPPSGLAPMLAELWSQGPFDDSGWRFEPKLDGVRTLVHVTTDDVRLVSRTGRDHTVQYPELQEAVEAVDAVHAVLDGEIVALEPSGRPSFELLQQRMNLSSPADIERARRTVPVALYLFDALWIDGRDLMALPLRARRAELEAAVTEGERVRITYFTDGDGRQFFEAVSGLGLEGMVAKRLEGTYQPGRRSRDWRKVKAVSRQDCVILGWTPGEGSRSDSFGALLLGAWRSGELAWIGQVGTGFSSRQRAELLQSMQRITREDAVIHDAELRRVRGARWVEPEMVCEVEYLEVTKAGKLRAPSFKGLRTDKLPDECVLEEPAV